MRRYAAWIAAIALGCFQGGPERSPKFGQVYDGATDAWSSAPPLPTPRHGLAIAMPGNRIYVIGGGPRAGLAQTDAVEVYTPRVLR